MHACNGKDIRFRACWWLPGRHGQTFWPTLTRKVRLKTRSERLELPDGDFTRLDWIGERGPIVIMLPGLQGDLNSGYVRGMMRAFHARGWRAVLLNHRGRVEPNRKRHSYHCGMTCDLDYLVHLLAEREPDVPIAVVGFSLGANVCLKWLGECGERGRSLPIASAVGVSSPLHPAVTAETINRGFARVYQWYLLSSLHRDMRRKMALMGESLDLTRGELRQLNTFYKFDDRVTARWNGFAGADDYYARSRSDVLLKHIEVPTLVVNANDDPLIPVELVPHAGEVSNKVTLEITEGGGHLGFVSGGWPWSPRYWLDTRIPAFLSQYLDVEAVANMPTT
jgi:predicted alpha/beta-fold hydrolase